MKKIAIVSLCFISIALTQCKTSSKAASAKAPEPAAASTTVAKPAPQPDPAAVIAVGQSIYNAKCGECHKLPQPAQYNQADWAHIMVKMSRKAHLSEEETAQVLAFLNSNAKP